MASLICVLALVLWWNLYEIKSSCKITVLLVWHTLDLLYIHHEPFFFKKEPISCLSSYGCRHTQRVKRNRAQEELWRSSYYDRALTLSLINSMEEHMTSYSRLDGKFRGILDLVHVIKWSDKRKLNLLKRIESKAHIRHFIKCKITTLYTRAFYR